MTIYEVVTTCSHSCGYFGYLPCLENFQHVLLSSKKRCSQTPCQLCSNPQPLEQKAWISEPPCHFPPFSLVFARPHRAQTPDLSQTVQGPEKNKTNGQHQGPTLNRLQKFRSILLRKHVLGFYTGHLDKRNIQGIRSNIWGFSSSFNLCISRICII